MRDPRIHPITKTFDSETFMRRFYLTICAALIALGTIVGLTGCQPQALPAPAPAASGVPMAAAPQGPSVGETMLAAGAGAAIGSMLGNSMSRPSAAPVVVSRPVIVQKTVINRTYSSPARSFSGRRR